VKRGSESTENLRKAVCTRRDQILRPWEPRQQLSGGSVLTRKGILHTNPVPIVSIIPAGDRRESKGGTRHGKGSNCSSGGDHSRHHLGDIA
jgi:hypothetical protein